MSGGKAEHTLELLEDGEQTLILFKSERAMEQFKAQVPAELQDRIAFEGERELSSIVRDFQQKRSLRSLLISLMGRTRYSRRCVDTCHYL